MAHMEGPGTRRVDNETFGETTRVSREGKRYTYKLNVLQQPLRARACGSGAKSSADRRPVDPPPIVELKIFEGENAENDVTFMMNADYMVFVTLEQARNQAHGRVKQSEDLHPVLKGMPVAGMVYLERPKPAGYFIFADLSVQHEGKYRLGFNLFEMLKDPKDEDQSDEILPINGSIVNRMEVKSKPFLVYSAKKFPGLTESTNLSRVVAEQGCRVRIRRDVRMRRRDHKSGKDWDAYEEDTAEARARVSATPEAATYPGRGYIDPVARPRSGSNASHQSLAPSLSRRPSIQDVQQGYQQPSYGSAPQTPQHAYPQSSPYAPGPSPIQPHSQSPFVQQSSMQPPPLTYHPHSQQVPPPLPPTHQQPYYGYAPVPPPSFEHSGHPQRHSADYSPHIPVDYRRSSAQTVSGGPLPLQPTHPPVHSHTYPAPVAPPPGYQPASTAYQGQRTHRSSTGSMNTYSNFAAPGEPAHPPIYTIGGRKILNRFEDKLPPLTTTFAPSSIKPIEPASPVSSLPQTSYYPSATTPVDSHKRNYAQVFSDRHLEQPLRQGARPLTPGHTKLTIPGLYPSLESDDVDGVPTVRMLYRRADGREISRDLPPNV